MTSFSIEKTIAPETINGEPIHYFTVSNYENNVHFTCVSYGATIMRIMSPDRDGVSENIVLCYESVSELQSKLGPYYGTVPGRYANRIAKGQFSLDGEKYQLALNNGPNALHGGVEGFDKKNWSSEEFIESSRAGVKFSYVSPNGEEGYPGELHVDVTYSLNDSNELEIDYFATTIGKATIINLTNHTYFNLSGNCRRKILDHKLQLCCHHYLPSNDSLVPTGELLSVKDTYYDFLSNSNNGQILGEVIPLIDGGGKPGLDHCFAVDGFDDSVLDPVLLNVATLTDEISGRQVICSSSMPGVQVYTGNWLSDNPSDEPHTQHNAICLETQHYPDSPNQAHFPSTVLRPGKEYRHKTVFSFKTIP